MGDRPRRGGKRGSPSQQKAHFLQVYESAESAALPRVQSRQFQPMWTQSTPRPAEAAQAARRRGSYSQLQHQAAAGFRQLSQARGGTRVSRAAPALSTPQGGPRSAWAEALRQAAQTPIDRLGITAGGNRKQREERSKMTVEERKGNAPVDFLRPIIADGDCAAAGIEAVDSPRECHVGAHASHGEEQQPKLGAHRV